MSAEKQTRRELALFAFATAAGAGVDEYVGGVELDGFDVPGVRAIARMNGQYAIEKIADAYRMPIETRPFHVSGQSWERVSTIVGGVEYFCVEDIEE